MVLCDFVRSHLFHRHIDKRDRQQQIEAGEAGAWEADQLDVMGSSLRRLPHHIGNQPPCACLALQPTAVVPIINTLLLHKRSLTVIVTFCQKLPTLMPEDSKKSTELSDFIRIFMYFVHLNHKTN